MTANAQVESRLTLDEVKRVTEGVTARFPDSYYRELDRRKAYPEEFVKAATAAGLHAVMIPAAYGGLGLGVTEASAIVEEIHRSGGVGSAIHAQMFTMGILARHGSDEQRNRILPELAAGRLRLQAFSLTEPNAGTDTSKITTRAERKDRGWVINGQKVWTSRAVETDLMIVVARTSLPTRAEKPAEGLSCFLVDLREVDLERLTRRKIDVMFNHHTYEVFYDDLYVPDNALIGEEGRGFRYLLDGLNAERILISAECIGDGRWFVEKAVRYANERIVFGRPIGANQAVQFPIAHGYAELEAASLMRWRAAELFDQGEKCGAEANMAKLLSSEASWKLANVAMQTFGGFSVAVEYDIERKFRENRVFQVAPVSPNMVLNYIGQHVLGMPRSY